MPEQPKPRRAPAGSDRKRDADRTRERILDAALVEFGEHGFAGARIGAIARRAGANQQLISYYFDGKEGLLRALNERWRAMSVAIAPSDAPLGEIVAGFSNVGAEQRNWVRLLVWQALAGDRAEGDSDYRKAMVDALRERQDRGEIAADLDPAYLQLILFGAALAPTLLADFAEDFTGLSASSPDFQDAYREQLKRVVGYLGAP